MRMLYRTLGGIGGISMLVANGIGTANTAGLSLLNNTPATNGAQQYSPMLVLGGQGYKSNATAASESVKFALQTRPVQGTTAASGVLDILVSLNGGAYSAVATLTSGGALTCGAFNGTGTSTITYSSIGTGTNSGLALYNLTAAAAGAQQYSPALSMIGYGWKTDATAASQLVGFAWQCRPIQGTSAPTGKLDLLKAINGAFSASGFAIGNTGICESSGGFAVTASNAPYDVGGIGGNGIGRINYDGGNYISLESYNLRMIRLLATKTLGATDHGVLVNVTGAQTTGFLMEWQANSVSKAKMRHNGSVIHGIFDGAPVDGDLLNSQIEWYLNEAGNEIKAKLKYAAGTVKTLTGALT
jgi:hypothetical protein